MNKNMALAEFVKQYPEYVKSKKLKQERSKYLAKKINFICSCKCGHVFDYRERIRFPKDSPHYAPCQGLCPKCGKMNFTFIGSGANVYPILFNFVN